MSLLFDVVFPLTSTRSLSRIVLTHGHFGGCSLQSAVPPYLIPALHHVPDHQGGVQRILQELSRRNMLPLPQVLKREVVGGRYPPRGFRCRTIADGETIQIDSTTSLQAIYTPGHTDDHVGFLLCRGDGEEQALLSGDCVLGCGTTVFDDLSEYMHSLHVLRERLEQDPRIRVILPGHGPVICDGLARINEYIAHRTEREHKILCELGKEAGAARWLTSLQLVARVYPPLSALLTLSAQHNVILHLEKLRKEGRVEGIFPDLWRRR